MTFCDICLYILLLPPLFLYSWLSSLAKGVTKGGFPLNQLLLIFAEITCPPLPNVTDAEKIGDSRNFEAVVTFTCQPGLRMESGLTEMSITCQGNGQWDKTPTSCAGKMGILSRV